MGAENKLPPYEPPAICNQLASFPKERVVNLAQLAINISTVLATAAKELAQQQKEPMPPQEGDNVIVIGPYLEHRYEETLTPLLNNPEADLEEYLLLVTRLSDAFFNTLLIKNLGQFKSKKLVLHVFEQGRKLTEHSRINEVIDCIKARNSQLNRES